MAIKRITVSDDAVDAMVQAIRTRALQAEDFGRALQLIEDKLAESAGEENLRDIIKTMLEKTFDEETIVETIRFHASEIKVENIDD